MEVARVNCSSMPIQASARRMKLPRVTTTSAAASLLILPPICVRPS